MRQINILGCGWLGLPLGKSLVEKGFRVKGSTTSPEKIPVLMSAGIEAFLIEVSEGGIAGETDSFLSNSEILVIDIPPKTKTPSGWEFVQKIKTLLPFIKNAGIRKVIFISSTAVYNNDYSIITETSPTEPDTESGKQLLEAEKLFLPNMLDFSTTIIRFGGLIGDDRHPVHHLSGKQNIGNPDAAVNLIHQKDCIGIIEAIIEKESWGQTFNAVTPFHPKRKDYYTKKALDFRLPLPEFSKDTISFGKIILANKVESELGYKFQNPEL